jgi:hypothetical protein
MQCWIILFLCIVRVLRWDVDRFNFHLQRSNMTFRTKFEAFSCNTSESIGTINVLGTLQMKTAMRVSVICAELGWVKMCSKYWWTWSKVCFVLQPVHQRYSIISTYQHNTWVRDLFRPKYAQPHHMSSMWIYWKVRFVWISWKAWN